ncbi:MAG: hypothetical protein OQK73_03135 [Gammaproteobacteria bacterium]|nr:hypothetical protein [Gammaproteobacteria bacterium]
MLLRILLVGISLATGTPANATEEFLVKFELIQGARKIEAGRFLVSQESKTWSKGLRQSYLTLSCHKNKSGGTEKRLSLKDHFSGLKISHKLEGENIEARVMHTKIQPQLVKIRELPKNKCQELSPIITTTSESYIIPAKDNFIESYIFGEDMTFKITLTSLMANYR